MKPLQLTVFALLLATTALATAQDITNYIDNDWPDSRYTVHGNGTVTDTKTGLMWKQCSQGQRTGTCTEIASKFLWKEALETAARETYAGYSDWRIPNQKELRSLIALDRANPAINISIFPNTPNDVFWSASPYAYDSNYSWNVSFRYGYDSDQLRGHASWLRLVRGGQ